MRNPSTWHVLTISSGISMALVLFGQQVLAQVNDPVTTMQDMRQCMAEIPTLRWTKMADRIEAKMNSTVLSPKERADWQADITSIRDVPRLRLVVPKPVDPKNPKRAIQRLTNQEHKELMMEVGTLTMKISEQCTARLSAGRK